MDSFNAEKRSSIMRAVKGKNTTPELLVRSVTHRLGYRFRLHDDQLPGKPDLVFPSRKSVIFVHGCFWHMHTCPRGARMPETRRDYWSRKLNNNRRRDRRNREALKKLGWRSLVIWECQTKDTAKLAARVDRFLGTA